MLLRDKKGPGLVKVAGRKVPSFSVLIGVFATREGAWVVMVGSIATLRYGFMAVYISANITDMCPFYRFHISTCTEVFRFANDVGRAAFPARAGF